MIPTHRDINLWDIKDGVIWGLAGEAGISLELSPKMDLRMCSSSELPGYSAGFSRLMSGLPVRFGLSFEVEIESGTKLNTDDLNTAHFNGSNPLLKEILKDKVTQFSQSGRTPRYLAHLWSGKVDPLRLRMFPPLLPPKNKRHSPDYQLEDNELLVREASQSLSNSLSSCGVTARILSDEEIKNRYWKTLNPTKSMDQSAPAVRAGYTLRSQLACANAFESQTYFLLDGQYHSAISFYAYPDELYLGSVDTLLENLPVGSRYLFSMLVPEQEEFLENLKMQRRRTIALAGSSKTKDYESQARESDLDQIITRCRQEGERVYVVWAGIILRSPDLNELMNLEKDVLFAIREIFSGAMGIDEDCAHRRMFLSSLPLCGHLSPRRNLMLGSTASAMVPLSRPWQGTKGKGMILTSPIREPVYFDIFDQNTPRHGIVIGTVGSGKSFSANMLLISLLSDPKVRALVIDIGASFKRLTQVLGGAFFDVRLDEKFAINPLLPRSSLLREDKTLDPDVFSAQCSLVGKIVGSTSGPGRLIIEKALEQTYRNKEEPLLSDFLSVLRERPWEENLRGQAQVIINELASYCEGVYSLLLSRPSKIRPFESQITTFELGGLKEHRALQSILVSVIAFSIHRQLEDRSIKKLVVIDEAWEFFNDEQSAELIARLYRQARKHNGAILTISQSPVEFMNSLCSPAILATSHWVMALKMASGHEMLEKFGFTDQSIERSKKMQMSPRSFSEVMVRFGDNPARIARISPNSLEYWIATTNAEEWMEEERLRQEKGLSVENSVREMAEKKPVIDW